jgi:hypothetical protein
VGTGDGRTARKKQSGRGRRTETLRRALACLDGTRDRALERLDTLETKLSKFATELGPAALAAFGYRNKADFVKKKLYVLRSYP